MNHNPFTIKKKKKKKFTPNGSQIQKYELQNFQKKAKKEKIL